MKIDKIKVIKGIVCLLCMGAILWCIFPIIKASSYSVLAADDFSHANSVGYASKNLGEYIITSIEYSKEMYITWQGTYFSMFLQALLSS